MLTSSFNHSKCLKKKRIMSQRSRFVLKEESSSSFAKIVKKRKRFAELTRHSRDAFRARIMTNSSINVMLIVMNMTKWTNESRKLWFHRSKNELANFFHFFRRRCSRFLRRSSQNLEKNEWCLILTWDVYLRNNSRLNRKRKNDV
jgi:hypothetical protein